MPRAAKAAPEPLPDPDEPVEVYPERGYEQPTAKALLDAADMVGVGQHAVESIFKGFRAPRRVIDATVWPTEPHSGRGTAQTPLAAIQAGALPGGADAAP